MDGFPLLKPTEVVEPVKYFIIISSIKETCSCHDFEQVSFFDEMIMKYFTGSTTSVGFYEGKASIDRHVAPLDRIVLTLRDLFCHYDTKLSQKFTYKYF
jgi:hypothetical protein